MANVAQLVEPRFVVPVVVGSSPIVRPIRKPSSVEGFLMRGTQDCAIEPRNLVWGYRALQFRLSRFFGSFRRLVAASLIVSPQKKCVRALFLSAMFFPLKNPPLRRVFYGKFA